MSRRVLTLFLLLFAPFACAQETPAPPAPRTPQLTPEASTIVVPVRASLSSIQPLVEQGVPRTFADRTVERGFAVSYNIARDPVQMKMIGRGLHATTTAHYVLQACRGRFGCISCGLDEPRREAEIALHSTLNWDASWRIRSVTTARAADYPKRCQVTPFGIDITNRFIAPVVDDQLRQVAKNIDATIPKVTDLRKSAQEIWSTMQRPVEIAPRTWLQFEPLDFALTPVTGSGDAITSTLVLHALTRITLGDAPPVLPARPLPALKSATDATGALNVPLVLTAPYAEASRLAREQFGDRTIDTGNGKLAIGAVKLESDRTGRIIVTADIRYDGGRLRRYNGPVYLIGTPRWDAATAQIDLPDLEYVVDDSRSGIFVKMAEHFAHDTLRDSLRTATRWSLQPQLEALRGQVTRGLTRQLAAGANLTANVSSIRVSAIEPATDALIVRATATGNASIQLTQFK